MTINTYADLVTAYKTNAKQFMTPIGKVSQGADAATAPVINWIQNGYPSAGAAPATKEAPTRDTVGAIYTENPPAADNQYILRFLAMQPTSISAGMLLIDILSWSAGLSGTTTGAQTTNLPTQALTRYTNGEGVLLGLICWSATGTTATTVTASYTNQAGTAGRTTTSVNFWTGGFGAGTVAPSTQQVQLLPLQTGDYGVRSVESVTIAASTGTAGNFGVVLLKPLVQASYANDQPIEQDYVLQSSSLVEKEDSACLGLFATGNSTVTSFYGKLVLVNG